MRNVKEFPLVSRERLPLGDRVRFLFYGRAYKRRFAARAAQHGIVFTARQPSHWFVLAAAAAMLLVVGWLGGQLQQARGRNRAMAADLQALRQWQAAQSLSQTALLDTARRASEVRMVRENPDAAVIQAALPESPARKQTGLDLEQARQDLERARAGSRDLDEQLQHVREQLDSLRADFAGAKNAESQLSDQLRSSELRLNGMTAELTRLQAGRSEDAGTIAAQKFSLRELTVRLNGESDTLDRERKLLVADLDIRELMGARSLHIVDVFDVDGKGKTQRPFGRVFYTEGKSLVFYAFDLKGGATFQAWGQRETKDESARSLGIFYVDDQKQNRWVLKFEDPKVLAEINAVFVTVEPPGGSVKPNRQKMLYAYLNATPNHP
jgi:hypothetical protein